LYHRRSLARSLVTFLRSFIETFHGIHTRSSHRFVVVRRRSASFVGVARPSRLISHKVTIHNPSNREWVDFPKKNLKLTSLFTHTNMIEAPKKGSSDPNLSTKSRADDRTA
jgi:hypothetical protein